MGVKDLWNILDPAAESCSIADLHGKCLAVDISTWIFQSREAQSLVGKDGILPHLRILFWRLYHLMRNQVRLVVVFDGACPDLKINTLRKRWKKPSASVAFSGKSKFRTWRDECKELLSILKVPYVTSEGDAEALCALLNKTGLVDGCITEDSDTFLFGARTVYRHFSCDREKMNNLKCYRMDTIEQNLKLSQNHLISMALLIGCDYGLGGVKGTGKEHTLQLMQHWQNIDPLERMARWRENEGEKVTCRMTRAVKKPVHCRLCGHLGSGVDHNVTGCDTCGLKRGCKKTRVNSGERVCLCAWHTNAKMLQLTQLEAKVKEAALKDPLFPRNELIKQYLMPDSSCNIALNWPRPSFEEVENYLLTLFKWERKKVQDKMAAYFTAYDMCILMQSNVSGDSYPEGFSRPDRILALKQENKREIYLVEWKSISGLLNSGEEKIMTHEFKDHFSAAYPQIAASYEGWLHHGTPTKNRKRRLPETPQGHQTTMDYYCVARKRLFSPLPAD